MSIIAIDTVFSHAIFVREDVALFWSTMHSKYLAMMQKRFVRVMYRVFLKREHVNEDVLLH